MATDNGLSTGFPLESDSQVEVDNEQFNQLLATTAQWPTDLPVEDLTGEVQDLMMRESMNSWLQPWMGENAACLGDFDTQMYAQSIQLEDLFGQDQLNFAQEMAQSAFYDELTFAPDDASSFELSAPTSSASFPSDSSAQISPVVQPVTDAHIDKEIVEKLQVLEEKVQETPVLEMIVEEEEEMEVEAEEEKPVEMVNALKRRRSSSSSEESSDDSSSEEEESGSENENVIPTTVANMNNRRRVSYSSSSDSESDSKPAHRRSRASSPITNPYIYMHKRQIEETLLDRITNNLNPEKLPGILPILSSEKASNQQDDEVEIDLSCLAREQLVQVLSYVDACILEQNGGPSVNVEHYIMKKPTKGPRTRPALNVKEPNHRRQTTKLRNRKPAKPRTKSRAELIEDIDADSSSSESIEYDSLVKSTPSPTHGGPMSMASLSKKNSTTLSASKARGGNGRGNPGKSPKNKNRRKGDDDAVVSSSVHIIQDPDSIASSRPKRCAAIHKRRLLEEMLAPSDNDDDEDSEDSVLVVYSDEQMDRSVVDNRTIMHQVHVPVIVTPVVAMAVAETEGSGDTDEEIDIMC